MGEHLSTHLLPISLAGNLQHEPLPTHLPTISLTGNLQHEPLSMHESFNESSIINFNNDEDPELVNLYNETKIEKYSKPTKTKKSQAFIDREIVRYELFRYIKKNDYSQTELLYEKIQIRDVCNYLMKIIKENKDSDTNINYDKLLKSINTNIKSVYTVINSDEDIDKLDTLLANVAKMKSSYMKVLRNTSIS